MLEHTGGGEISLHLDLPEGSVIDLLQLERPSALCKPRENVRQFNGLLKDLAMTNYRADLVLVLHVLEHCDDPVKFVLDLEKITNIDGIVVIEVPYELHEVFPIVRDKIFELPHHYYFTMESLKTLIGRTKFEIMRTEVDHNSHTGAGDSIYPIIRIVCKHRNLSDDNLSLIKKSSIIKETTSSYIYTVDRLFKNFSGSLAFVGKVKFKVFVYLQNDVSFVNIFKSAPGYLGIVTSNPSLPFDNVFSTDLNGIDFIFTLNEQDRTALRTNLVTKVMIQ